MNQTDAGNLEAKVADACAKCQASIENTQVIFGDRTEKLQQELEDIQEKIKKNKQDFVDQLISRKDILDNLEDIATVIKAGQLPDGEILGKELLVKYLVKDFEEADRSIAPQPVKITKTKQVSKAKWNSVRDESEKCDRCGRVGHTVVRCFAKTDAHGQPIQKN